MSPSESLSRGCPLRLGPGCPCKEILSVLGLPEKMGVLRGRCGEVLLVWLVDTTVGILTSFLNSTVSA